MVIGIDIGSEMHYARILDYSDIEFFKKLLKFSNSEAGFEIFKVWILDIKEKHEKDRVVSGMERPAITGLISESFFKKMI